MSTPTREWTAWADEFTQVVDGLGDEEPGRLLEELAEAGRPPTPDLVSQARVELELARSQLRSRGARELSDPDTEAEADLAALAALADRLLAELAELVGRARVEA